MAGSWVQMDDTARQFVARLIAAARAGHAHAAALAALAERLQEQAAAAPRRAISA